MSADSANPDEPDRSLQDHHCLRVGLPGADASHDFVDFDHRLCLRTYPGCFGLDDPFRRSLIAAREALEGPIPGRFVQDADAGEAGWEGTAKGAASGALVLISTAFRRNCTRPRHASFGGGPVKQVMPNTQDRHERSKPVPGFESRLIPICSRKPRDRTIQTGYGVHPVAPRISIICRRICVLLHAPASSVLQSGRTVRVGLDTGDLGLLHPVCSPPDHLDAGLAAAQDPAYAMLNVRIAIHTRYRSYALPRGRTCRTSTVCVARS
jgi:hypothetical protein